MRSGALILVGAATLSSVMVAAQVRPVSGTGDPRLQTVDYRADQVVTIEGAPGYQVTIELAPDETIESAAVGDSGAWQVSANKAGNRLFVKPLQSGSSTNMTVITSARDYAFDLVAGGGSAAPYTVRFRYPLEGVSGQPVAASEERRFYKVGGAKALRPSSMTDDGVHTYIEWPADAPLPATYVIERSGREALANGNMRGPLYVLDTVADRLVFRIDRQTAVATRQKLKRRP